MMMVLGHQLKNVKHYFILPIDDDKWMNYEVGQRRHIHTHRLKLQRKEMATIMGGRSLSLVVLVPHMVSLIHYYIKEIEIYIC